MKRSLVVGLVLALGSPAAAYVRSTTESGAPISWTVRNIDYLVNLKGSDDLTLESVVEATQASFQAWEDVACSDINFNFVGTTDADDVGYSTSGCNRNIIVFRESESDWNHQRGVIAVTTVTYCSAATGGCPYAGAVLDADIELNGAEFTFSNTADVRRIRFDLANTLTHEVGHLLGLDHTPIADATMFASAPPTERSKATLHEDDMEGLCAIYPLGEEGESQNSLDSECNPGSSSGSADDGCAAAPAPAGLVMLVGLLGLARRRLRA